MVLRKEHARQRRGMGCRDLARSEADLSAERRRREQRNPGAEAGRWYRSRQFWPQRPQCRAIPLDPRHGGGCQGERLYRRGRYRKAHPEVQADLGRATIGALPAAAGNTIARRLAGSAKRAGEQTFWRKYTMTNRFARRFAASV